MQKCTQVRSVVVVAVVEAVAAVAVDPAPAPAAAVAALLLVQELLPALPLSREDAMMTSPKPNLQKRPERDRKRDRDPDLLVNYCVSTVSISLKSQDDPNDAFESCCKRKLPQGCWEYCSYEKFTTASVCLIVNSLENNY